MNNIGHTTWSDEWNFIQTQEACLKVFLKCSIVLTIIWKKDTVVGYMGESIMCQCPIHDRHGHAYYEYSY